MMLSVGLGFVRGLMFFYRGILSFILIFSNPPSTIGVLIVTFFISRLKFAIIMHSSEGATSQSILVPLRGDIECFLARAVCFSFQSLRI